MRLALAMGATIILNACAVPQKADPVATNVVPRPELSALSQWLGTYRSIGEQVLNLEITMNQDSSVAGYQSHWWIQWADGDASNPRRFLMRYATGEDGQESYFAPVSDGQVSDRRCLVDWQVITDTDNMPRLFGQTSPTECRFSTSTGELGLLKEWSFDGQRIQVADQLVDLSNGLPVDEAQIVEFVRIERFEGWAAVADNGEWRVDERLRVLTDGQRRASQDAAGMSLNIGITLERKQTAGTERLQLVVSDETTGEVLGQAWTEANAATIGWANESVQVELVRQQSRAGTLPRSTQ